MKFTELYNINKQLFKTIKIRVFFIGEFEGSQMLTFEEIENKYPNYIIQYWDTDGIYIRKESRNV
uniref:Uncharacterized protein n=1 Tax=Tectiviridae sp. cthzn51 TaxID=2826821 RepID=A0A8S5LUH1_9VIRU|nr:MAG TPA: hypothetical protein [Tectiviridae sp. cthzn51]